MATIPMLMLLYVAGDFTNKVCMQEHETIRMAQNREGRTVEVRGVAD